MKVRLGVTRSANEGSELWYQVLEKNVGSSSLSLDHTGDVCLEVKDGEWKEGGWGTNVCGMHVWKTSRKHPHSESEHAGYSVGTGTERESGWLRTMLVHFSPGNTEAGACQRYLCIQGRDVRGIQTLMLLIRLWVGPKFPMVRTSTIRLSDIQSTKQPTDS